MVRTVKHFSLHRITGTELRVVADVEAGVLPVVQVEEAVIRGYTQQGLWPHRWVTLFVLQDLQPLVRQLTPTPPLPLAGGGSKGGADPSGLSISGRSLPPGGAAALNHRPVVNIYDLADPAGCHVFVNRQAMAKEGYWDDALAIQGLLAHEHAHPLAENEATRASRQLRFAISDFGFQIEIENRKSKIRNLLTLLADKLCLYAPRELFANEMTIRSGFSEALLHLDRRTVANASRSVAGREDLRRQLQQEIASGNLTPQGADLLLLIGDLKGYLDLALEVAPFYRTGRESDARELEAVLEAEVFPHLEPEVPRAYIALREQYIALRADLTPPKLTAWGEGVLNILAEALAEKGLVLQYHLRIDKGDA
ncbi:MAG: hypothetical protein WBW48_23990 [Anaerolineae bacterium]